MRHTKIELANYGFFVFVNIMGSENSIPSSPLVLSFFLGSRDERSGPPTLFEQ